MAANDRFFIFNLEDIGGVEVDASLEESYNFSVQITDNPVESGVVLSDHRVVLPKELTVRAAISNSPFDDSGSINNGTNFTRTSAALELLINVMEQSDPFEVQTGLFLFSNMLITNIATSRDKNSGDILDFTATMREVQVIEITAANQRQLNISTQEFADRAGGTAQRGQIGDAEVTDVEEESANVSLLKQIKDRFS